MAELKNDIYSRPYARISRVCEYLDLSDGTVRNYIAKGYLRSKLLGGCIRVLTDSLKEFELSKWEEKDTKKQDSGLEKKKASQTTMSNGRKPANLVKFRQEQKMKRKLMHI